MAVVAVVLVLVFGALLAALIAADRRPRPALPFPWLWTLPSVVVIGLSVLVGVARYPALPDEIPVHFDLSGVADRYTATTPFTALFPIVVQVLLTAVLTAAAALVLRTTAGVRRVSVAAATLLLAAAVDLAFFLLAQPIWRGRTTLPGGIQVAAVLLIVAGVVAVLATSVRAARAGDLEQDDHWLGVFYVNRHDRKLFVPKRFGIGWTVNLGRPAGWAVLAVLVGVPVLTAIFGHHAA